MANSKFEYVKAFEKDDRLLPSTFIVVRIDGKGFHKLSQKYSFEKPNDRRALDLMNAAAAAVLKEIPDIVIAYGVSDEFSIYLKKGKALLTPWQGTLAADKNEILFSRFKLNYNLEPDIFKKGSVLYRKYEIKDLQSGNSISEQKVDEHEISKTQKVRIKKRRERASIQLEHIDLINDEFWSSRPWILGCTSD
ncbi:tRNA-His guanylyltransferase [Schaereria dolodes]|nr:tRNA-His guanylyltransferase [Schaereria dolodes]